MGVDSSVTDGYWIIELGTFGVVGFAAAFGLIGLPVFRAAKALKYTQTPQEREHLAALAVIVAIAMIDQLPNASFSNWTWLLVGALLGRAEALWAASRQQKPVENLQPSLQVDGRIGWHV
jgi:hypothetical protein